MQIPFRAARPLDVGPLISTSSMCLLRRIFDRLSDRRYARHTYYFSHYSIFVDMIILYERIFGGINIRYGDTWQNIVKRITENVLHTTRRI